jgi:DNA repair protein RadD
MKTKKELRYFQRDACSAIVRDWKKNETPCISVMTALGKSLICAALANWALKQNGRRILILVPTKELVEQNYIEAAEYCDDPHNIGIVCKQLKQEQGHKRCVIAMYQSFNSIKTVSGAFDYVVIDEAHLVSNNDNSVYRKIIRALQRINPNVKISGMTATPFRLGQGLLTNKCLKGHPLFTSIPYDTSANPGLAKLVDEGYLAQIETINTSISVDLTGVKMSGLDYNSVDVGIRFDSIAKPAVENMRTLFNSNNINSALIFASNIANANHIAELWGDDETMRVVDSKCSDEHRASVIAWLKSGLGKRYVVNVGILTTGFNYPALECIVLLRATTSPGLLIQMIGRLIRPHGGLIGKVIDFGTNISRLGGIDDIKIPKQKLKKGDAPKKACLECGTLCLMSAKKCPDCGSEFIAGDDGNYTMITHAQAMKIKNTTTHAVASFNLSTGTAKTGAKYICINFLNASYTTIYREMMWLTSEGYIGQTAGARLKWLFMSPDNYFKLVSKSSDAHFIVDFINENMDIIKTCSSIELLKNENNKYKKLTGWTE